MYFAVQQEDYAPHNVTDEERLELWSFDYRSNRSVVRADGFTNLQLGLRCRSIPIARPSSAAPDHPAYHGSA